MIKGVTILLLLIPLLSCVRPDEQRTEAQVWADLKLHGLTLDQKIGQLFSIYAQSHFTNTEDPTYLRLIDRVERLNIGGIIFFQGEPLNQAVLANDLQQHARIPLLISQDMEWGPGMRLPRATSLPHPMALGATRNEDLAYAAGYMTAREARALGTHQIFSPVADVNNNPENPVINVRAFGEHPEMVGNMVAAYIKGAQDAGVLASAKHFPGHGDTVVDSHNGLPILRFERPRLDSLELAPFRAAIKANVGSIMVAHLALPALESDITVPASLSSNITRTLLRDEMGFKGLVVSDALNMKAVTDLYGSGEAAVRALEAGIDMLLYSEDEEAAIAAVREAVDSGRLSTHRIDASVRRVLTAKAKLKLHINRKVNTAEVRRLVSARDHQALGEIIAHESLTLLGNRGDLLPILTDTESLFVLTISDSEDVLTGAAFREELEARYPAEHLVFDRLDPRCTELDIARVRSAISGQEIILVPTFASVRTGENRLYLSDGHRAFLDEMIAEGKKVVLISFGNPYLPMGLLQQPDAYVAAYSWSDASQKATAASLLGQGAFQGRLPVSLPGLYAYGEGIQLDQVIQREGLPEEVGMDSNVLAQIDSLLNHAIKEHAFPGAAVAIGRQDAVVKMEGYGHFTYLSDKQISPQSVFDLASLTKVIATTTAVMQLYEQERLDLEAPVAQYLPEFGKNGKEDVTIRHLLTHTGGLIPFRPFHQQGVFTRDEVLETILGEELVYEPGSKSRYSDFGPITIGLVIESITGQDLASYTKEHIFEPLGMHHTGYRIAGDGSDPAIVPTEVDRDFRKRLVQGEVHDETAYILGGTAGHAGLFSTAEDLSKFAYMLLNEGQVNGKQFLTTETIHLFTTRVDPEGNHSRALGWDTKKEEGYNSAGLRFGPNSYGHTGFTGTSFWIDPDAKLFAILLTNRVYPTRYNRGHVAVRPQVADIAFDSIIAPDGALLPGFAR